MNKVKSVYSPSENAIYNAALYESYIKEGTWPQDGIEISDEDAVRFNGGNKPTGKCWEWFQGPLHGLMSRRFHQNRKYQMQKT